MYVVKTVQNEFDKSIIVEHKLNNETYVYDVRVGIIKHKINIVNIGKYKKPKRTFIYLNASLMSDYDYRSLRGVEKEKYFLDCLKDFAPKEVLNLAVKHFIDSLDFPYFE